MKNIIILFLFLYTNAFCLSQTTYIEYYNITYKYYNKSVDAKNSTNIIIKEALFREAFLSNKPLAWDLFYLADAFYSSGNFKKGTKYLLNAANSGFEISNIGISFFIDSLLNNDDNLRKSYEKKYCSFLKKNCDLINSIKILKLFQSDEHIRMYFRDYAEDTLFGKFRAYEMIKIDSINYFTLLEIMGTPNFNSSNLTDEAKLGIGIILQHSATRDFANTDTVFALLKKEMLKGVINPRFYANCVDRYYMIEKGMNYYCSFYDEDLPIYDIANVDKRRAEVWLYPLYFKFKWSNKLDQLPKDYTYDIDTIGQ